MKVFGIKVFGYQYISLYPYTSLLFVELIILNPLIRVCPQTRHREQSEAIYFAKNDRLLREKPSQWRVFETLWTDTN